MKDLNVSLDEQYFNALQKDRPDLHRSVCELVEMGQSPAKIERVIKRLCPKFSVIPGLARGTAEHYKRIKNN